MGDPIFATYYDVESQATRVIADITDVVWNSEDYLYDTINLARDSVNNTVNTSTQSLQTMILNSSSDIKKRLGLIEDSLEAEVDGISGIVADSEFRIIRQIVDTENRLYDSGKQIENLVTNEALGIRAYVDKRAIETEQHISDEIDRVLAEITGLEEVFESAISGLAQGIIGVVEALIESIGLMVSGVANAIGAIIEGVITLLVAAIEGLTEIFKEVGVIIADGITEAISYIGESIVTLTEWLGKTINGLVEGITAVLVDVGKSIATAVEALATSIGTFIEASAEVIANVGGAIADLLQQLVTIISDMWEAAKEWGASQEEAMAQMAGITTTGSNGKIQVGNIQELIAGILTTIINEYYKLARTSYDQFGTLGD